jgi:predicted glycoside hydrolase/deacetylase ChbG (UPF0249 family)
MTKRIVLCADDYGQAPSISQAILALLQQGRLSATSCLVTTSYWPSYARTLSPYQQKIDIGLHLNFSEGEPISKEYRAKYGDTFLPLSKLMKRVFLRPWDMQAFMAEAEAQVEHFFCEMGFLPHYLDGHQHIHQFPGIRQVIINLYKKYFPTKQAYVRLVNPSLHVLRDCITNVKKSVVMLSGAFFRQCLDRASIPHNISFSGIYHFNTGKDYRREFLYFLKEIKDGGLIMCHPGMETVLNCHDKIASSRYLEYQYLSSPLFLEDCLTVGIVLERFRASTPNL